MSTKGKIEKTSRSDTSIRSANWQAGVSGWELTPTGSLRIYGRLSSNAVLLEPVDGLGLIVR